MAVAYLALGSNVGDREAHLERAVAALRATPGLRVRGVSRWHETDPVGGPAGQGPYLNGAAAVETSLSPRELLAACLAIELAAGRDRGADAQRWGPRTLDVDVLLYDDRVLDEPGLVVPHPRMHERRFVLEPLAEIAPHVVHPTLNMSVQALFQTIFREDAKDAK